LKKQGGILIFRADIDSTTVNKEDKTFDVVFATENPVLRSPWWSDETFYEVLVCDKKCIRAERLDGGMVPLLDMHSGYSVTTQYGIERSWSIVNKECRAKIQYSLQDGKADLWKDIEGGIIKNISVGAKIYQYERVPNTDPKKTPTYRAIDWEVNEISMATVQLDYKSSVRAEGAERIERGEDGKETLHEIEIINYKTKRSVMKQNEIKELRVAVRAAGLDDDYADALIARCIGDEAMTMDAARAEILSKKPTPAAPKVLTQEDITRAATEERQRGTDIRNLVRTQRAVAPDAMSEEFADDMIGRGLTLDAARAEILNKTAAAKSDGPANGGPGGASARGDERTGILRAMSEGMMHRAEPGSVENYYKLKPKDGGDKYTVGRAMDVKAHDYKYMSFLEISRAVLTMNGVAGVQSMSPAEVVKRALDTTDLPDLFTSTVNRFMRLNYEAVVPEWMQFSRPVQADDFRTKTGIKFDAAVTFEELAEDGEYKESNMMSNEKATIQLKTYARSFGITRKTIINDDQGVLNYIPRFIGLGASQFQSKSAWANITGNVNTPDGVPLFDPKHKNYATGGAASAIVDAALSAGRTAMRRQKSPQGNELDIKPAYLLVPPELQTTAEKLLRTISPTLVQNVNIWGTLEPFTNVYLSDPLAWYLVANPNTTTVDGMVHSYLSGQEGLFTESYVDKKTDKIVIKARLDFATAMWGSQGWYKNAGAAPIVD